MTIELPKPIAVTPVPNVRYREFTKCGQKPLTGGQIWTYEANSTTPKITYQDPYGMTPNTNPIILDAAGEADVYLNGTYRFVVKDKNGVVQKDVGKIGSWYSGDIEDQFKSLNDALENSAQQLMQPLQDAIAAAAAAGAGAEGWTDTLVATSIVDAPNQNLLNAKTTTTIESIADLSSLLRWDGRTVYVKSYYAGLNKGGSTRIYKHSRRNENDGFLCINGWVLQIEGNSITPEQAGAVGDDANYDDTDGIQKCTNAFRYVNLQGKRWNVSKKITIPSGRVINMCGSNLDANNGEDTIFEFEVAGDGLRILHGGGFISGVAGSFLKCAGTTDAPTTIEHYARQIRLDGVLISSKTIDKFLDFQGAVRQVFMHKVHAYTRNGINANGKCVEVKGHGCIIYGSTSEATTYGIRLRAPAGGANYSEGFHFTDCTIDEFGTTFDVTDIYTMSITSGHVGCVVGNKVAVFGQPNSTACRDIKFTGVNINGPIEFAPVGGLDYHAKLTGCVSESCVGINIHIKNNASSIDISDHKFHTSSNGVAVVCNNGANNININGISCDSTFIGGIQFNGADGINSTVRNLGYAGTGNSIYTERPVLMSGIPVTSSTVLGFLQKFNASNIDGAHALGANIASVDSWFAKGETGNIICEISFNGANSSTQRFDVVVPDGMEIPSGAGWNAGSVHPNSNAGRLSVRIPYRITKNITGQSIALKNAAGSAVNVDYHSSFGFKRDW